MGLQACTPLLACKLNKRWTVKPHPSSTSVEPQHKRLGVGIGDRLRQVVEESSAEVVVDSHEPGELREAHMRLAW